MEAGRAYRFSSIDAPANDDDDRGASPAAAQLGEPDTNLEEVEQRMLLSPLIASLPKRDRAAEFRTNAASAEELLAFLDATAKDCRALLATEKPFDPAAERIAPDTMNREERESVTAAWAMLHALEHLHEHLGHAGLTRQLWEERSAQS